MNKIKCCVCEEEIDFVKMYSYFKYIEDKFIHSYEGHKSCLFMVDSLLTQGKELPYTVIEMNK